MLLLKAVGASEYVGCRPNFCAQNGLRHKAMVEIHNLRKQLTNQLNDMYREHRFTIDPNMSPPTDIQAKHLRMILLSGLFDHVARRIPDSEKSDDERKKLKDAYQSIEVEAPVFIGTNSILKHDQPEYVVYQEIHETSKMYMRNVAVIEPQWLALYAPNMCHFSKPLEEPCPRYDLETDSVKCHFAATFGTFNWPLPQTELDFPPGRERFKWFAKFLLEGRVVPQLEKHVPHLLTPPSIMIKSWAQLQTCTQTLLQTLISENVDSNKKLQTQWEKDDKFLFKEYLQWLPEKYHPQVIWPPISLK
jgi:ATP-dependent RNA helicase DHX37/DHR1